MKVKNLLELVKINPECAYIIVDVDEYSVNDIVKYEEKIVGRVIDKIDKFTGKEILVELFDKEFLEKEKLNPISLEAMLYTPHPSITIKIWLQHKVEEMENKRFIEICNKLNLKLKRRER